MKDLPRITKHVNVICKNCYFGKQARSHYKSKEQSTFGLLGLIHIDLDGPTRVISLQGERYFMISIDDYSRNTWVTFLREKSNALDRFKIFKYMVENEVNLRIKFLSFKKGG